MPLADAAPTLDPADVFENFYSLTQVPRQSHHEELVRDFLVQFGGGLGLETRVDAVGNVLIRRPAAPGMENQAGVVLQAHMDMVPQKAPESTHDFLIDPIQAFVDGDWIVTDGTTLGADNGIGLALAQRAAREGMRLVLADIDEAKLAEAAKALPVAAEALCTRRVDVSREEDVAGDFARSPDLITSGWVAKTKPKTLF